MKKFMKNATLVVLLLVTTFNSMPCGQTKAVTNSTTQLTKKSNYQSQGQAVWTENKRLQLTEDNSITFANNPAGKFTCQKFYIDQSNTYLYATYKPAEGLNHLLCRYVLTKKENGKGFEAVGESFVILADAGHGMILDGEEINGETYLYVGCNSSSDGCARGIARINYNKLDRYVYKNNKWCYSGKNDQKHAKELKPGFYNKKNVASAMKCSIDKKWKIKSFASLLPKDTSKKSYEFVKGDFCIAETRANMVYVKYTETVKGSNKKTNKMIVRKVSKVSNQIEKQIKQNKIKEPATFADIVLKDNDAIQAEGTMNQMMGSDRTCWQATAAWTQYDCLFTTQEEVSSISKGNMGLYINRRKGNDLQNQITYKLALDKNTMLKGIAGYPSKDGEDKWRLEVEGIQLKKQKMENTQQEAATLYVYLRNMKEKEYEKIYYVDIYK